MALGVIIVSSIATSSSTSSGSGEEVKVNNPNFILGNDVLTNADAYNDKWRSKITGKTYTRIGNKFYEDRP